MPDCITHNTEKNNKKACKCADDPRALSLHSLGVGGVDSDIGGRLV